MNPRMNLSPLLHIARREILAFILDRKAFYASVLVPLLIIPVLMLGLPVLYGNFIGKTSTEKQQVAVQHLEHLTPEQRDFLETGSGTGSTFQLVPLAKINPESLKKHPVVLDISKPLGQPEARMQLYFNSTNQKSALIGSNLKQALENLKVRLIYEKVDKQLRPLEGPTAFQLAYQDTASKQERQNGMLFFLIPIFLIQFIIIGGQAAAIDTLAGEREKGTFENLLAAPVPIQMVLQAKLLTVIVISLISSACVFLGLSLSRILTLTVLPEILHHLKGVSSSYTQLFGQGIQLDLMGYLLVALVLFSFALISSAVQYHISMTSRSVKEAQSRVAPIGIVIATSALIIQFSDYFQSHNALYFAPVINNMLLIIDILKNQASTLHLGSVLLTNVLVFMVLYRLSMRFFAKNQMAFRNR
ncbi:ABC transporter permease [Deinococcus roseus]|uniref:Sodium ABC transporter permease n=1 Tax=Deinococcus roseus TaxID=392414 RepID=A0ABQ2DEW7_9DEIO|nr:ABC transporter permease subunit [Deinococcus roseus]GGJ54937.1 sodium ABC transporter permease [Deinococcus roseus]